MNILLKIIVTFASNTDIFLGVIVKTIKMQPYIKSSTRNESTSPQPGSNGSLGQGKVIQIAIGWNIVSHIKQATLNRPAPRSIPNLDQRRRAI